MSECTEKLNLERIRKDLEELEKDIKLCKEGRNKDAVSYQKVISDIEQIKKDLNENITSEKQTKQDLYEMSKLVIKMEIQYKSINDNIDEIKNLLKEEMKENTRNEKITLSKIDEIQNQQIKDKSVIKIVTWAGAVLGSAVIGGIIKLILKTS